MAVVTCPQCGKMVSTGAAACTYCGSADVPRECRACRALVSAAEWPAHRCSAVPAPAVKEEETFICDRCGADVAATAAVCPACGNDVTEVVEDGGDELPAGMVADSYDPLLGGMRDTMLRCGRCRQPVVVQFNYCPNCGLSLRAATRPDAGALEPGAVLLLYGAGAGAAYLCPQCDREIAVTEVTAIGQCPHCGALHFPGK